MKKIISILTIFIIFSINAKANDRDFNKFVDWLIDNNHTEYVEINENYEDCKNCTSSWATKECYEENGKPKKQCVIGGNQSFGKTGGFKWANHGKYKTNLDIKITNKELSATNLAYHSNPNRDSLIYYLWKYSYRDRGMKEFKSKNNSEEFKFNLIEDKYLKKQMKTKGILSYLYYQDGKVLIDEFSPEERLGKFLNNETKFYSMSMSKSVTSYLLGHAICDGYIDGVDARMNDWPLLEDSIYHNQKIINFLNMNTGDQKYIDEFEDGTSALGTYEDRNILATMVMHFTNNEKKKSKNIYNYNGFVTQLILNYLKFKTGKDYEKLYGKVFNDKIKIKHSIMYGETEGQEEHGNGHPNIKVTRYDWLRIAKAIMDDYQNETCVGKYLKEIHERRIPKNLTEKRNEPLCNRTRSYGGQFHMDYPGLKDKVIFGMGGYGGNVILIDMENSRILVLNSLHYNNTKYKYNHKKLLLDRIKNGIKIN